MLNRNNIFTKRLEQLGLKKKVDASIIVESNQKKLNDIFGKDISASLRVISFNKGVLKIAAKNSAWANECQSYLLKIKKPPVERVVFVDFTQDNL